MASITSNAPNSNQPATRQHADKLMAYAPPLLWTSASLSSVGLIRPINEDSYLDQPERGLWVVADGMGGHARGDLASRLVIEALSKVAPGPTLQAMIASARDRLLGVNRQLRTEAANQNVGIIGSTVVVLLAFERECGYLWAGDSRIYLFRDGAIRQITRDHSRIEALKAMGTMTDEMLANHPARNTITRAVGAHGSLELDDDTLEVSSGDMFLLCSDGLSNEVSEDEMQAALAMDDCRLAVDTLMNLALMRGGHDNISIVIARADDAHAGEKTVVNPLV